MTKPSEREELYKAVVETPTGAVLEVGSWRGKTTLVLIEAAKQVGKQVYSVDPYPEELEGKVGAYTPGICARMQDAFRENVLNGEFDNITQFNYALGDCINRLPQELSVVFIDGLHEYGAVETELKLVYPRLVECGRVYIHDTSWAVGQLSGAERGGVCNIKPMMKMLFDWQEVVEFPNMICGVK